MYFWKFWRDTRRSVYIYLILLIFFATFWLFGMYIFSRIPRAGDSPEYLWAADLAAAYSTSFFCALVMSFAAGSSGVGNDIGKGSADFLLTRPCSRKYFVWAGWFAGISEVFALVVVTAMLVLGSVLLATGPVWRRVPSLLKFEVERQVMDVPLMATTIVIVAAVIFGLNYFFTTLFKARWRGMACSLAVIVGYETLSAALRQLASVSLPSLNFAGHPDVAVPWYLAPRFEIVLWAILAVAFPFAAQFTLERSDI